MSIRIAAIGVGHWHSLFDAAYLKTLARMPEVQLVGLQDPDVALGAERAAQVGGPAVFGDYREMLASTRPDFVLALGRPRRNGRHRSFPARRGLSVPDGESRWA
jgi:predicted dehydrogenase